MKLKFEKNENGEISVKVNGRNFSTQDYIQMVKDIKNEEEAEAEFDENISEEEKTAVNSMLEALNNMEEESVEEQNDEDIPF